MKKEDNGKTRVCVQYDDHSRLMCTVLCSLMEHQSLVDLAIRCGNNTMHAHKCILAASSPYFREQLEKNPGTEQVIINGLDFGTMKSVIEFIYCGETNILEEHLKPVVAAAKLFQIQGLQALASETHFDTDESIQIPAPIFMNKKPKYSSAYIPFVPTNSQNSTQDKNVLPTEQNFRRLKRKYIRTTIEAEKACAREARASRLALEALKKELGPSNQMHNFEIEDTCTETTVENFIPHTDDDTYINELDGMPLQVVNYTDLNTPIITTSGIINLSKGLGNNIIPFEISTEGNKTIDKIKDVFCQEMQTNVEIMYKTPEGEFVKVTDEVLRNITGDTLQFQVIDENGKEGEVQLLDDKIKMKSEDLDKNKKKFEETFREFINTTYSEDADNHINSEACDLDSILLNLQEIEPKGEKNNVNRVQPPRDMHISKFDKIMADLNESNQVNDKAESPHDKRLRSMETDDTDILKEINSMQYYDKSVYEDVAEQIESAFQQNEERAMEHHNKVNSEVVCVSDGEEGRIKNDQTKKSQSPSKYDFFIGEIGANTSPKYSPRKTRSTRMHNNSSPDDMLKSGDLKRKVCGKKK